MSRAVMQFIAVVSLHFPPPIKSGDETMEEAWTASMVRNMRGYAPDVLAAAAQEIIDTRTPKDGRFFPLPSECKAVCDRLARVKAPAAPLLTAEHKGDDFAEWRIKLADDLVQTELGRQAAREGWVMPLHLFCRQHARLPKDGEIATLRRQGKEFADAYRWLEQSEHPLRAPLMALGDAFRSHREQLRKRVLGEAS